MPSRSIPSHRQNPDSRLVLLATDSLQEPAVRATTAAVRRVPPTGRLRRSTGLRAAAGRVLPTPSPGGLRRRIGCTRTVADIRVAIVPAAGWYVYVDSYECPPLSPRLSRQLELTMRLLPALPSNRLVSLLSCIPPTFTIRPLPPPLPADSSRHSPLATPLTARSYPQPQPQQVYVQQPQKQSGGGGGCLACLAGMLCCCCGESTIPSGHRASIPISLRRLRDRIAKLRGCDLRVSLTPSSRGTLLRHAVLESLHTPPGRSRVHRRPIGRRTFWSGTLGTTKMV